MTKAWTFHPSATSTERQLDFGSGTVVKKNRQRTVTQIDGSWYVKTCRIDGPRAWFRDLFRGAKAKLEYDRAQELIRRGIPVPVPIAWCGGRLPGESAIVTRTVAGAVPLDGYLETQIESRPARERRQMAVALGRFLRQLAEAGIAHPDPHPGNFLVSFDGNGEPGFTLLDLHAVRIGPPLTDAELEAVVVPFNRWFQLRTTRTDRLRFLLAVGRGDARRIETATMKSNLIFWQRRFDRYRGTNREYRPIRGPGLRGMTMTQVPEGVIKRLLADPDALFVGGISIKSSKSSTVIRFAFEGLGDCILKRVPVRTWLDPIKNALRPSSLIRSWRYGQSIHDRGLPTPRPLMLLHRCRFGFPAEGYLLTQAIPDSTTLADWVRTHPSRDRLMAVAERLGRVIRTMHERGVAHRDLKASNILIDPNDQPWLIDLVGVTTHLEVGDSIRQRDIARLAASFVDLPIVSNAIRLRFLQMVKGPDWKESWRAIQRLVVAKVDRNHRRGRVLG